MDNQHATTPEGFRAAAYLEARARLDAGRKTNRNVKCNPPNVRCGNRCIPPTWDCRLKGEGGDKHLAAVKTDPLGGLANIERGSRRIIRGVAKGSFSEVEGGKRAIIRGTVKIAPGNLQQKKELQAKLENRTRAIGIGLAVLTGGLGAHALLMKQSPFYRKGLGQSINESVQHGVNSILDATPGIAGRRSRTRIGAYGAISEAATRETRNPTISPAALTSGLDTNSPASLNQLRTTQVGVSNVTGNSNLNNALSRVNTQARQGSTSNIYEWDQKHREAFWNTSIKADEIDRDINVFARPAAENFIRNQYNITTTGSATDLKEALRLKLSEERNAYVQFAKQAGFRTETQGGAEFVHKDDQFRFIQTLNRNAGLTGTLNRNAKDLADAHVTKLISPTSLSGYSRSIYNQNLKDFDRFYTQVGAAVRSTPGAASLREELALSSGQRVVPTLSNSQQEFVSALSGARVAEMSRRLSSARLNSGQSVGFSRPIAGNAHSELVKTAYYHIEVIGRESQRRPNALNSGNGRFRGPRTYTITDRLATNAASDLSGRSVSDPTEAFRLLNSEYGFPGATRVQAAAPARRQSAGATRQAGLTTLARDIMARSGNEGMTLEAALRAARQERGDAPDDLVAPEVVRTATYLAARADLKESPRLGKPCGASHIPKAHECRKSGNQSKPSTGQILTVAAVASGAVVAASVLAANPKLRQRAWIGGKRLTRGTDATVRQALILGGRGTIAGLSTKQVKAGLDKLPEAFQAPARQLVGAAKQSAAAMSLRAEGYSIQDIDVVTNYSTWKNKQGTILSIGSYGDSLVTYASSKSHTWKGKPVYKIGFNVDQSYDATRSMPGDQARSITAGVRKMSDNHLAKINDGILATFPWDGDEYGAKRRAIYTRAGFNNISGEASQWALVEKGRIKKMSSSESFIYLAESGERDAPIYKPSKARRKDSLGVDEAFRSDKRCGKSYIPNNKKCVKPIVQGALVAAGVGLVAGAYLLRKKRGSVTLAEMIPLPSNKSANDWFTLPRLPGITEGSRVRKYSSNLEIESIDNATFTKAIKDIAGETPEGQLMANLIEKRGIKTNSRLFEALKSANGLDPSVKESYNELTKTLNKQPVFEGAFVDPHYPGNNSVPPENEIWINHHKRSKTDFTPSKVGVTTALQAHIKARQNSLSVEQISQVAKTGGASKEQKIVDFTRSYTTYSMADGDDRDFIVAIHESAHALDIGFARRKRSVVDPIDNAAFERQANKVISHYGLSDINGKRDEFFAESAVLYTLDPSTLKKQAPMVYSWVDSYLKEMSRLS